MAVRWAHQPLGFGKCTHAHDSYQIDYSMRPPVTHQLLDLDFRSSFSFETIRERLSLVKRMSSIVIPVSYFAASNPLRCRLRSEANHASFLCDLNDCFQKQTSSTNLAVHVRCSSKSNAVNAFKMVKTGIADIVCASCIGHALWTILRCFARFTQRFGCFNLSVFKADGSEVGSIVHRDRLHRSMHFGFSNSNTTCLQSII